MKQDRNHDGGALKNKLKNLVKSPKVWIATGIAAVSLTAAVSVIAGAGFLKDGFDPSAYGSDTQESNDVAYDSTVFGANQDNNNGKEMDQNAQDQANLDEGEDPLKDQQAEDSPILIGTEAGDNNDAASNVPASTLQGTIDPNGNGTPVVVTNKNGTDGNGSGTATPTATPAGGSGTATPTKAPSTNTTPTPEVPSPTSTPDPTPAVDVTELISISVTTPTGNTSGIDFYQYMTLDGTDSTVRDKIKVTATYKNKNTGKLSTGNVTVYSKIAFPKEYDGKTLDENDIGTKFNFDVSYTYAGVTKTQNVLATVGPDVYKIREVQITKTADTYFCVGDELRNSQSGTSNTDAVEKIMKNIDVTLILSTHNGHVDMPISHYQIKSENFGIEFNEDTASKDIQSANIWIKYEGITKVTLKNKISYLVTDYRMIVNDYDDTALCTLYSDNNTIDLMKQNGTGETPYALMLKKIRSAADYDPNKIFVGWVVNKQLDTQKDAITKYKFAGSIHSITLYPYKLVDKEDTDYNDFIIDPEGSEQVLVGFNSTTETNMEVPFGVTSIKLDENFEIKSEEKEKVTTITIPATVHEIDLSALAEIFPNLTEFKVEDDGIYQTESTTGALYTDEGKTLLCLPVQSDATYVVPYSANGADISADKIAAGAMDAAITTLQKQGKQLVLDMTNCLEPPVLELDTEKYAEDQTAGFRILVADSKNKTVKSDIGELENLTATLSETDTIADYYLKYFTSSMGKTLDDAMGTGEALKSIIYTPSGAEKNYQNTGNTVYSQNQTGRTLEFVGSDADENYMVEDGITAIANHAFEQAIQVRTVTVPDTVTDLAFSSFATSGNRLTSVTVSGTQKINLGNKIAGDVAETDANIIRFFVSEDQENASSWRKTFEAQYGSALTARMLVIGNSEMMYVDGCVYLKNRDTGKLTLYYVPEDRTEYTAPEGLVAIASGAFSSCQMTSLILPEVTEIADGTFAGCTQLELLMLSSGENVTVFDDFADCESLRYIVAYHAEQIQAPETVHILEDTAYTVSDKILYQQYEDHNEVVYAASDISGTVNLLDSTTVVRDNAFMDCTKFKGFSDGEWSEIQTIGDQAFSGCSNLVNGLLTLSAKTIGKEAFRNCDNITQLRLDTGITDIGERAFADCKALTYLDWIADTTTVGDYLFENDNVLESINVGDPDKGEENVPITQMGDHTFEGLENLVLMAMHTSFRNIGNYAFANCVSLQVTKDVYSDSTCASKYVESVGNYAFAGCTAINGAVLFNESTMLTTYGVGAFQDCTGILNIVLPPNLTEVPDYCFLGCSDVTIIYMVDGKQADYAQLTRIGTSAFSGCELLNKVFNLNACTSLKTIEANAFSGTVVDGSTYKACNSVQELIFPSSLEKIGENAFQGLEDLQVVDFGACTKLTDIAANAFADCSALLEVNMEAVSVKTLDKGVLSGCASMTTLVLPKTLTNIKKDAVTGCTSLGLITTKTQSVIEIESGALGATADNSGLTIYVPAKDDHSIRNAYIQNANWISELKGNQETIIKEMSDADVIVDGGVYSTDSKGVKTLKTVLPYREGNFVVQSDTNVIAADAFTGCNRITIVNIPDSIKQIPDALFKDCTNLEVLAMNHVTAEGTPDTFTAPKLGGTLFGNGTANKYFHMYTAEGFEDFYKGWTSDISSYGTSYRVETNAFYGIADTAEVSGYQKLLYVPKTYTGSLVVHTATDEIAPSAAEGCKYLTSVTVGAGLQTVGARAFAECSSLQLFWAPNVTGTQLYEIGDEAFLNCTSLVGRGNSSTTQLILPIGIRKLGRAAFKGCTALKSVSIQGQLADIPEEAFSGCTALTTYTGTATSLSKVVTISKKAFYNCKSITSISWTNMTNLTSVGESAYEGCSSLFLATFANKLTSIGSRAFWGTVLQSISFNGTIPPALGDEIMDEEEQAGITIFVPNGTSGSAVAEAYYTAWVDKYPILAGNIQGLSGNTFRMISNVLYLVNPGDSNKLEAIKVPASLKSVSLYDGSTTNPNPYCISINAGAFKDCKVLEAITVTSRVERIEAEAFENCVALATVTINSTAIKSVGANAFANCVSLTALELPRSVTELGDGMLSGATALKTLTVKNPIPGTLGTKLFGDTLPDGVKIVVPVEGYDQYMKYWGTILDRDYGTGTAAQVIEASEALSIDVSLEAQTLTPEITAALTPTATPTPEATIPEATGTETPSVTATPEATTTPEAAETETPNTTPSETPVAEGATETPMESQTVTPEETQIPKATEGTTTEAVKDAAKTATPTVTSAVPKSTTGVTEAIEVTQ